MKVCCIADAEEAALALAAGAAAVGLVAAMPSGPGVISEERIAAIVAGLPPEIGSFLLTSERRGLRIVEQLRRTDANTVQIVDRPEPDTYAMIRELLPDVAIVQVIHVTGAEAIEEARLVAGAGVDAILLDSGDPRLPVKELGGTGRTHDWAISRRIREAIDLPVFLAGGLGPDNLPLGVRSVGPFGLDVCSGLRTGGRLDAARVAAFFTALREASTG